MKIVYFGFDLFADCFSTLCNMENVEIMALYTFPTDNVFEFNREVIAKAKEKGIPYYTEKITAEKLEEYFDKGCDITFSAGYIHKIPVLCRPDFKGINVHPAMLPIGRGAWPFPCTILKEHGKSGVTIHKITNRFDEGDILLQKEFPVAKDETLDTLTEKAQKVAKTLTEECVNNFEVLWENAKPQGKGEYWAEPTNNDRIITNDMTVVEAEKIIRAFGSFGCLYNNEEFKGKTNEVLEISLKDGKIKLKK